jgi:hypothetical protein
MSGQEERRGGGGCEQGEGPSQADMDVLKKNTVCMFITIAVCGFLALGFDTVLLELVQNKFGTERYLFYDTMRVRIRLDSAKRSEEWCFDLV